MCAAILNCRYIKIARSELDGGKEIRKEMSRAKKRARCSRSSSSPCTDSTSNVVYRFHGVTMRYAIRCEGNVGPKCRALVVHRHPSPSSQHALRLSLDHDQLAKFTGEKRVQEVLLGNEQLVFTYGKTISRIRWQESRIERRSNGQKVLFPDSGEKGN